ncbi:DNA primase family protein [Agrococcus casei]|uniref:DNA primase family protein n=1 Tax=Agrococcus casei TaxID=343512 RepID=UPI003F92241A
MGTLPENATPDNCDASPASASADAVQGRPAPTPLARLTGEMLDYFALRDSKEPAPQNLITTYVTETYLERINELGNPGPKTIEEQLLELTAAVLRQENRKIDKGEPKLPAVRRLDYWQVAQVLLTLHHVIRIAPNAKDTDREYDLLAMYRTTGKLKGTYTTSEDDIRTVARSYNARLMLNEFKEIVAVLKEDAPRRHQCGERDLVAVNNGVFHYGVEPAEMEFAGKAFRFEPKSLNPFDPAIVFVAKSRVNYVKDAPRQVITHPEDGSVWDVEGWLEEMFDETAQEGLSDLIWEILGAIVRPHVRWGKTAWFYSEVGNNGKGTLCSLMRNLIGEGSHTSIPLSDFGKNFALEPLVRANAIIVDENDVGTFIDKAANMKAIVTNDVIQIDRKHKQPIAFQFWGFMVQCLNEFPLVKDKSESFYRRQLFVPFIKSYTGKERKYIKGDYLQRQEVLEYVLWRVLHVAGASEPGNYYELSEPMATQIMLSTYKEENDPVRMFWTEFKDQFMWDALPFPFLYDLYKVWFANVSPSGLPIAQRRFSRDLTDIVRDSEEWSTKENNRSFRPGGMMSDPEPLIVEYQLKDWMDPLEATKKQPNRDLLARPILKPNYTGLLRNTTTGTN